MPTEKDTSAALDSKGTVEAGFVTKGILQSWFVGVYFVILKLMDELGWSWIWVTAPFWGAMLVVAAIHLCIYFKILSAQLTIISEAMRK